jgi:hypothetical protein
LKQAVNEGKLCVSLCVMLHGVCIKVPTLNLILKILSLYRISFQLQFCFYYYVELGNLAARTSDSQSENKLPKGVMRGTEAYCLQALVLFPARHVNVLRTKLPASFTATRCDYYSNIQWCHNFFFDIRGRGIEIN